MKAISFKDLKADNVHGYTREQSPAANTLVLKEMVFPGAFGYPDMYVRHTRFVHNDEEYLLISQTDYELTDERRLEIVRGAQEFLSA